MTNKSLIKNILSVAGLILCVIATLTITSRSAYAYSAAVTFSPEREEVRVGDEFFVSLEVSADITPGSFEGFISYDSSVLEYMDGPLCISGSEGVLKINDQNSDSSKNTRKYLLYFRASAIGYATFNMLGEPQVYDYDTGLPMPISVSEATVKVLASKEASDDSSLALLKISPGTLSPSFAPETFEYTTKVDESVDNLIVSAMTSDNEAKVLVKGSRLAVVGKNTVSVTVTAQDGSVSVYTIAVMRGDPDKVAADTANNNSQNGSSESAGEGTLASGDSADMNGALQENKDGGSKGSSDNNTFSTSFYASEIGGTLFLNSSVQYRICDDTEGVKIPSDYSPITITISGNKVTAYEKKDGSDDDFLLMVLEREGSSPKLYRYDRVEKTIQRYTEGSVGSNNITKDEKADKSATTEKNKEVKSKDDYSVLVVTLICIACIAVIVILIRLNIRRTSVSGRKRTQRSDSDRRNGRNSGGRTYQRR